MKKLLFLLLFCPIVLMGQNLLQAEYFFDEDPGYGKGITMKFSARESVSLASNLYIGTVSPGYHTLYYRFKDDQNDWGQTFNAKVFVGAQRAQLQEAEYFFDEEPGYDNGVSMNFEDAYDINLAANLYIALISPGYRTLYYRFKDDKNGWGHTFKSKVFVGEQIAKMQETEYFFDEDPGYGKGVSMKFEDTTAISLGANLYFDLLSPGLHTFYYRMKSEKGWGNTFSSKVFKPSSSKICKLVYWFDENGEDNVIPIHPKVYTLNYEENIDIESLDNGGHTIHLYVENENGLRSDTVVYNILKGPDAISDLDAAYPSFYPNPANNCIQFSGNIPVGDIHIFSIKGALVRSISASEKVNVSDLPEGLYLISYQVRGKYRISTLVIEH